MTPEELDRKMEFIVDHQAQFAADMIGVKDTLKRRLDFDGTQLRVSSAS